MNQIIFLWELFGAIFISVAGCLLHFVYDSFNRYKPLALISAVNESTWEHLKIAFWPTLAYSIFEYASISSLTNNFIAAKAACLLIIPVSIIIIFYTYTAILGRNFLIADIFTFVLSICLGQLASFKLLTIGPLPGFITSLSLFIIVLLIIQFSLFTFFPPKFFLFKDPVHGGYGIYQ